MYWPENAHIDGADLAVLAVAKVWLDKLYTEAKERGDAWIEPHITTDYDGDIDFEWWHGQKTLTALVCAEYVSWFGESMPGQEVFDNKALTEEMRRVGWQWFVT